MRVGMLVYGLDRHFHGIGRYTSDLTRALATAVAPPELVLLATSGLGPLGGTGLPVVQLRGCGLLPGLLALGNLQVPWLAQREGLDIVHDPTGITPFGLGAGPAKTIVTVHDVIPWSYPGVSTALDTWIYRYWLPHVLPRVDAVVTVSHFSKAEIVRHLHLSPEKVAVVHEGPSGHFQPVDRSAVEEARARYGLPKEYVLSVGALAPRKNLGTLLHAFAQLRQRGLPYCLVLVGPQQPRYSVLDHTVRELGLEDAVVFTGYVDDADLPAVYCGASVFVFPSLFEGFGLPPIEAMACGVPVVASNNSSLPEVVGNAGLLVDPHDVDAIASAIQRVLTEDGLRSLLASKGLARAERFQPARIAAEMCSVYQHVLGQKRSDRAMVRARS
jgi:glycosyltransferase involved in cell wall biosynthesis